MPFGDRTGPVGLGPMTGRAAGFCAGYTAPGFMNPIPGRFGGGGFWGWGRGRGGWGRGFGRGRGRWFGGAPLYGAPLGMPYAAPYAYGAPVGVPYAQPNREQEMDALKGQAEYLEDALEGIRKRLTELEAGQAEKK